MGSGKSHWGRIWSKKYNLSFYDLDEEIEKQEGETVFNIFKTKGEEYFRQIESNSLKSFSNKDNFLLACGGGTPCFNNNIDWINKNGTSVYLKISPEKLLKRLRNEKDKRPLLTTLSDDQLFGYIQYKLTDREQYYLKADFFVEENKVGTFELLNK